jgi:hypothetical protein
VSLFAASSVVFNSFNCLSTLRKNVRVKERAGVGDRHFALLRGRIEAKRILCGTALRRLPVLNPLTFCFRP